MVQSLQVFRATCYLQHFHCIQNFLYFSFLEFEDHEILSTNNREL